VARSPDPVSSKVSRFVFGAVGGGITAWFSLRGFAGSAAAVYGTIAVFAVIGGLVAMLLGGLLSKRMSR
jgi:uncharacterized membrane protein